MTSPREPSNSRIPGKLSFFPYDSILKIAAEDPRRAFNICKQQLERAEGSYTDATYNACGAIVAFAYRLRDEPEGAQWFIDDELWQGRRPDVTKDPLFQVFKWFYNGMVKGANYERARMHARALRHAFDSNMPAEEIRGYLVKNGGLDCLARGKPPGRIFDEPSGEDPARRSDQRVAPALPMLHSDSINMRAEEPYGQEDDPFAALPTVSKQGVSDGRAQPHRAAAPIEAKKQSANPKYNGGTGGYLCVEVLVRKDLFDQLIALPLNEGCHVVIYRAANGESRWIRLEGEGVPVD